MKKNKKFIILIVGLVLLVIIGLITVINYFSKAKIKDKSNENQEIQTIEYDEAYNQANELYSSLDSYVEFKEENDYYEIVVKDNNTNEIRNIFHMDKKTGIISEVPSTISETITFSN